MGELTPANGVPSVDLEALTSECDRTMVGTLRCGAAALDLPQRIGQVAPDPVIQRGELRRTSKHPRRIRVASEEVVDRAGIGVRTACRLERQGTVESCCGALEIAGYQQRRSQVVEGEGTRGDQLGHAAVGGNGRTRAPVLKEEGAERVLRAPVGGFDVDGLAEGALGFRDSMLRIQRFAEPDVTVGILGIAADDIAVHGGGLLVAATNEVELAERRGHLAERGIELQGLAAGSFRLRNEGCVAGLVVAEGIALAESSLDQCELRVVNECAAEALARFIEGRSTGVVQLGETGKVQIERAGASGGWLGSVLGEIIGEHYAQGADDR